MILRFSRTRTCLFRDDDFNSNRFVRSVFLLLIISNPVDLIQIVPGIYYVFGFRIVLQEMKLVEGFPTTKSMRSPIKSIK